MNGTTATLLVLALIVVGVWWLVRQRSAQQAAQLDDARSEARRWVERLGGQVLSITGNDEPSRQAMADASERYTAAGSQMDQASTVAQARQVTETAYEGLYYVRAARTTMGLDPGPDLPPLPGQQKAGAVSEDRDVEVEGHSYSASPSPSDRNRHFYPGGNVAGRPVPRGWYSEPWWKPALVAGAWGMGSMLLFSAMFSGMAGVGADAAYADGFADGAASDAGGDMGGEDYSGYDNMGGGDMGGDMGGGDFGFDF